jgi:hypothetical protein
MKRRRKAALDYETQASHTVTVTATDSSDASATIDVTINVDNVEESGTVTLSSDRFTVGETIVATLTDPDGSITETTWLWERSLDKISWTAIGGATSAEYTPILEDAGHYLRVTASYAWTAIGGATPTEKVRTRRPTSSVVLPWGERSTPRD